MLNFNVKDPAGHTVEIVQYMPDGWSLRDSGKFMSDRRISDRMIHAGVIVNSLAPEMDFYKGVLGFTEIWRGSRDDKILNWVNMKAPDTTDYVEFMLHDPIPEPTTARIGASCVPGSARYREIFGRFERARREGRIYTSPGNSNRRQPQAAVEPVRS